MNKMNDEDILRNWKLAMQLVNNRSRLGKLIVESILKDLEAADVTEEDIDRVMKPKEVTLAETANDDYAKVIPSAWPRCVRTIQAALRFLADNDRPTGGEELYNAAHLHQLADEIGAVMKKYDLYLRKI